MKSPRAPPQDNKAKLSRKTLGGTSTKKKEITKMKTVTPRKQLGRVANSMAKDEDAKSSKMDKNNPRTKRKMTGDVPEVKSDVKKQEMQKQSPITGEKSGGVKCKKPKMSKHQPSDHSQEYVQQTGGVPDGAPSGDENKVMTGKKAQKLRKREKDGSGERKENKPLKLKFNKNGVKNLSTPGREKKGIKRKYSAKQDGGDAKKPKLVEMKKKDRKEHRKSLKSNYDCGRRAKQIWEELRKFDVSQEKKQLLCDELYGLVQGKCKELIFAHDTCRVIQCLVKYGTMEHRTELFEELKDDIIELSKSKYAKFFVRKLMKYGTKEQKNLICKCFYGKVRKLIRHSEAAEILEYCYNEHANAIQRAALVEEFYGPSFALFKTGEIRTLEELVSSDPLKKESILSNMREALTPLIDKNVLQHSLVHRIFYEFLQHATDKMKTDMIEALRENVLHMIHTRDGSRVGMMCLWFGTAKDRKLIIKSFKSHAVKIAKYEHGHMVLLAMFDVVDDTKLVSKAIIEELCKSLHELAQDQLGRKVLLYLLSPRDTLHFHPDIIKILQTGDTNQMSKKDRLVRQRELLQAISQPVLDYIVDHTRELVMGNSTLLLIMSILTHAIGNPTRAMKAVAEIAAEPFKADDLENRHILEHPAGHITLKRLILNDKERMKSNEKVLFSKILLDTLPAGSLKSWATCNRGCFILVVLLELGNDDVTNAVKEEILRIKESIAQLKFKGSNILAMKLES